MNGDRCDRFATSPDRLAEEIRLQEGIGGQDDHMGLDVTQMSIPHYSAEQGPGQPMNARSGVIRRDPKCLRRHSSHRSGALVASAISGLG